jgi:hypothetical protein
LPLTWQGWAYRRVKSIFLDGLPVNRKFQIGTLTLFG